MIKRLSLQAIELTKMILRNYSRKDTELLSEYLHPDVLWIGPEEKDYIHGSQSVAEYFTAGMQNMADLRLEQEEYEIISNSGPICVVVGRYTLYYSTDRSNYMYDKRRITFVWINEGGSLKIQHIHLSEAVPSYGRKDIGSIKADSSEYMRRLVVERKQESQLSLKDCHGITRILNYSDIRYVMANHNYTILFCVGNEEQVRIRRNLSEFITTLPENFVQISRSCCVNIDYIDKLKKRTLILIDGSELIVPARKCADFKKFMLSRNLQ